MTIKGINKSEIKKYFQFRVTTNTNFDVIT